MGSRVGRRRVGGGRLAVGWDGVAPLCGAALLPGSPLLRLVSLALCLSSLALRLPPLISHLISSLSLSLSLSVFQLVDPYWTILPVLLGHFYQYHSFARADETRSLLAMLLIWTWSVRLTHSYMRREEWQFGEREDWRFTEYRRKHGAHFWWTSFFVAYLSQQCRFRPHTHTHICRRSQTLSCAHSVNHSLVISCTSSHTRSYAHKSI
jgi:Protein of unknown function (DUF1295)